MRFLIEFNCVIVLATWPYQIEAVSVQDTWPDRRIVKRSTGAVCITSCDGLNSGDYQSCKGCHVYATCSHGVLYDNRPCPAGLVWNDNAKYCDWSSPTCTAPPTTPGTPTTSGTTTTATTPTPGTGVCITDCAGRSNGDYQSCISCTVYATCANGVLYDNRPCPTNLVWEDTLRRCEYHSTTCP